MKILFWICIIGFVCGLLSYAIILLKSLGYCKRKGIKIPKNHALEEFVALIKIVLTSAIPIYNYFLLLCVLFYDNEKFEQFIKNKFDKNKSGGE